MKKFAFVLAIMGFLVVQSMVQAQVQENTCQSDSCVGVANGFGSETANPKGFQWVALRSDVDMTALACQVENDKWLRLSINHRKLSEFQQIFALSGFVGSPVQLTIKSGDGGFCEITNVVKYVAVDTENAATDNVEDVIPVDPENDTSIQNGYPCDFDSCIGIPSIPASDGANPPGFQRFSLPGTDLTELVCKPKDGWFLIETKYYDMDSLLGYLAQSETSGNPLVIMFSATDDRCIFDGLNANLEEQDRVSYVCEPHKCKGIPMEGYPTDAQTDELLRFYLLRSVFRDLDCELVDGKFFSIRKDTKNPAVAQFKDQILAGYATSFAEITLDPEVDECTVVDVTFFRP